MNENELELETLTSSEQNKKSKTKFIIGGLLIVIAIGIGLYFGYKRLNNDPVSIYKDSINSVYKSLNSMLKDYKENAMDLDASKEPFKIKLNAKLDSNIPELDNFTNLNYKIGLGIDYSKELMNLEFGVKDKNETIMDAILAYTNESIYLKCNELFSKVIKVSEENIFEDATTGFTINGNAAKFDYDNYELILKEMKTILIDSLDKDKFKTEDSKITISNKEYKGKKVSYILDEKNMERTINFIKEQILSNAKLKNALIESLGISESDLETSLKEKTDLSNTAKIVIVLYTDNLNNVIAGELLSDDTKVLSFDCVNKEFNFIMEAEGQALTISKDKNDLLNFKFNDSTTDIIELLLEIKNNKEAKLDYRFNIEGTTFNGTIEETIIKRTKDATSGDLNITFNTSILGKPINLAIKGDYAMVKESVSEIDTTGSIKMDDMTDAEAGEFLQNLNKILEKFGLQDLLTSMM